MIRGKTRPVQAWSTERQTHLGLTPAPSGLYGRSAGPPAGWGNSGGVEGAIPGWVCLVMWKDIQPNSAADFDTSVIDAALADAAAMDPPGYIKIRVRMGTKDLNNLQMTPTWVNNAVPTVLMPDENETGEFPMPKFWLDDYLDNYVRPLVAQLAARYDGHPRIASFEMTIGANHVFQEQFLIRPTAQYNGKYNPQRLFEAGLREATQKRALLKMVDIWSCFHKTYLSVSLSPLNTLPKDAGAPWDAATNYVKGDVVTSGGVTYVCIQNGSNKNPAAQPSWWTPWYFDDGSALQADGRLWTVWWLEYARARIGMRMMLGNVAWGYSTDGNHGNGADHGAMYAAIAAAGKPIYFQTAASGNTKLGNLPLAIVDAAALGASMVELPSTFKNKDIGSFGAGTCAAGAPNASTVIANAGVFGSTAGAKRWNSIRFDANTATAALRGIARRINANPSQTNVANDTVTVAAAFPAVPAAGDTFTFVVEGFDGADGTGVGNPGLVDAKAKRDLLKANVGL